MKVVVTGACGFVGSSLIAHLQEMISGLTFVGIDNLSRPGVHVNRGVLARRGVRVLHGDLRCPSDLESLPGADWVIDAAANPSVMAGVDGLTSSRQILEHNLLGTINLLEYCKRHKAGFVLLSTSRVYGIEPLARLPVEEQEGAFRLRADQPLPLGVSSGGITEDFSTRPPLSLYGNSKLCSESLALEYGAAFGFPVWLDRCGLLAGAGQFGRPDQGIIAYWIHSWYARRPLRYIGFGGGGAQVRDVLHPRDLADMVARQLRATSAGALPMNLAGGLANSCSLTQLSRWCSERLGAHVVQSDPANRPFDIPWMVLDCERARRNWDWAPSVSLSGILEEIAVHAEANPGWLDLTMD